MNIPTITRTKSQLEDISEQLKEVIMMEEALKKIETLNMKLLKHGASIRIEIAPRIDHNEALALFFRVQVVREHIAASLVSPWSKIGDSFLEDIFILTEAKVATMWR
jgi:hypothetical protein